MTIPALTTDQMKARVVELLAEGLRLVDVARVGNMPSMSAIARMRREDASFDADVKFAMQVRVLAQVEEIVEIADRAGEHVVETVEHDDTGNERTRRIVSISSEHLKRDAMRIATRQWNAERLIPQLFGARTAHEHSGPGGGPVRLLIGPTAEAYEAAQRQRAEPPKD